MTKLTKPILKDLIRQVYEEAYQDLLQDPELDLSPLPAEPSTAGEEPPEVISEDTTAKQRQKITRLLSFLSPEERKQVFSRYGFYSMNQLLRHLNNLKRADKGEL